MKCLVEKKVYLLAMLFLLNQGKHCVKQFQQKRKKDFGKGIVYRFGKKKQNCRSLVHSRLVQYESVGFFMLNFIYCQLLKRDWLLNFFEEGGKHMTKCKAIVFVNQKRGVDKTTTALNLGIGFTHKSVIG